ncbi:MAG: hypothetical protein ACHQNT_12635 [Bacteroidia bacterium]
MNTNKILLGTIVGGIAYFLLGWIIYGMMMQGFMTSHYNQCMMKPETDFTWWALIISNFAWSLLYAVIISWGNMASVAGGAKVGLVAGALIMLSFDLSFYSMSTMYDSFSTLIIDVVVGTILSAIGGAVIGWVMGRGKTAAA